MSKFLNLVEDHKPEKDIDELTDGKRSLQRLLLKNKIEAHGVAFQDIIRVRLDDGRVVELEVKNVQHPEDDEMKDSVEAISAIASLPDQSFGGQLTSKTKRNLQMAKRKMSKAALKIAKKFEKAAGE